MAKCIRHNIGPESSAWKSAMDELVNPMEGEEPEPFEEQVCPACFLAVRDKYRTTRRTLRAESREAIELRSRVDQLQAIVDAVIVTVKEVSGKDPVELAKATYEKPGRGVPGTALHEHGDLKNILPNLIAETARGKK